MNITPRTYACKRSLQKIIDLRICDRRKLRVRSKQLGYGHFVCRLLLFIAVGILIIAVYPSIASAQIRQDIATVLAGNAEALDPCRIEWSRSRQSAHKMPFLVPKLRLMGHYREDTSAFLGVETGACFVDGDKVYAKFTFKEPILKELKSLDELTPTERDEFRKTGDASKFVAISGYNQRATEISFNGTHVYYGDKYAEVAADTLLVYGRKHIKDESVKNGLTEKALTLNPRWLHNYLQEAGFYVPTNEYDYEAPKLQSLLLYLTAKHAAKVSYDTSVVSGHPCLQVKLASENRSWIFDLDKEQNYGVRRHVVLDGQGRVVSTTTADDFRSVDGMGSLRLPYRIVVEYHQWRGSPDGPANEVLLEEHYTVTACSSAHTPATDFELKYEKPGTIVGDDRFPTASSGDGGLIHYTVPASPSDLDAAVQNAIDGTPYLPEELRKPGNTRLGVLALTMIVVVVLAIVTWHKHWHHK